MAAVSRTEMNELLNVRSALAERLRARINRDDPLELEVFRWAIMNSNAIRELRERPGVLIVRYEDLCANPTEVVQDVFRSVGLPWAMQVERFIRRSTALTSPRFYGLYRRPDSVDQWRRSIPVATQQRVLEIVRECEAGDLYARE